MVEYAYLTAKTSLETMFLTFQNWIDSTNYSLKGFVFNLGVGEAISSILGNVWALALIVGVMITLVLQFRRK